MAARLREGRRFINAVAGLARGEYNPDWVDYPEEHVQELGGVGGMLAVGVNAAGTIVQHAMGQARLPSFGFKPAKRKVESGVTRSGKRFRRSDSDTMAHRRISTGEKEDAPTPMETEAAASSSSTVAAASKTHETKITPPPRHIKPGMPEYFTTKLVFSELLSKDLGKGIDSATGDIGIRVNSIYDVLTTAGGGSGVQYPRWRDYFSNIYDYYTVLDCEIHVTAVFRKKDNTGGTPGSPTYTIGRGINAPIRLCWRTYGTDEPTSMTLSADALLQDLSYKHVFIAPAPDGQEIVTRIHERIDHSDYTNKIEEIKQDSKEEIWTAVGADPGLIHRLKISPRTMFDLGQGTAPADNLVQVTYHIHVVYTVQFKEAKIAYKFQGQA